MIMNREETLTTIYNINNKIKELMKKAKKLKVCDFCNSSTCAFCIYKDLIMFKKEGKKNV